MAPDDANLNLGRKRATQIFRYLEALNQLRSGKLQGAAVLLPK